MVKSSKKINYRDSWTSNKSRIKSRREETFAANGAANDNARHSVWYTNADDESILRARWRYAIPEIYEADIFSSLPAWRSKTYY